MAVDAIAVPDYVPSKPVRERTPWNPDSREAWDLWHEARRPQYWRERGVPDTAYRVIERHIGAHRLQQWIEGIPVDAIAAAEGITPGAAWNSMIVACSVLARILSRRGPHYFDKAALEP